MKLERYFLSLSLAGFLFANPTRGLASDNLPQPIDPESNAVEKKSQHFPMESAPQGIPTESSELAALDYCYAGSMVDPVTGEVVDLFVLCAEDRIEQSLDIG